VDSNSDAGDADASGSDVASDCDASRNSHARGYSDDADPKKTEDSDMGSDSTGNSMLVLPIRSNAADRNTEDSDNIYIYMGSTSSGIWLIPIQRKDGDQYYTDSDATDSSDAGGSSLQMLHLNLKPKLYSISLGLHLHIQIPMLPFVDFTFR